MFALQANKLWISKKYVNQNSNTTPLLSAFFAAKKVLAPNRLFTFVKMRPLNALAFVFAFQLMFNIQQQILLLLGLLRINHIALNRNLVARNARRRQRFQPYWMLPRPQNSWFEIHYNDRNIREDYFRRQMRMGRNTFDLLLNVLRPYVQREDTRLRKCISPERVVAIAIYRLAHGGTYENAGVAMNVGKTTAYEAFWDVVERLHETRGEYIKFPTTVAETAAEIETFEPYSDLPNIVGAIDGTHIKIKRPRQSGHDYFSRYHQHDVVTQAIVNGKMLFLEVATGFPGSMHDARVLRNTVIYTKAENGDILANGPMFQIGQQSIQPYLVGDSAYPHAPWLQKPYPEGSVDPDEIHFSRELSAARVKVECAFGVLKARWRILDFIEECNVQKISQIIMVCVVLHNFCIRMGDNWDEEDPPDDDNPPNPNNNVLRDGDDIREILKDYL